MSKIQQFNDTGHIRYQGLPSGGVVGDLLWFDGANGRKLRTSVNDPIDGIVASVDIDGTGCSITISNGATNWKGGYAPGVVVYEDTTNPSKTTNASGGKRIGVIKGGSGGLSGNYEGDSFFVDCFNKANNGLSSKDGYVQLGNDVGDTSKPAKLKSNREVPMAGDGEPDTINFGHRKPDGNWRTRESIEMSDCNIHKRYTTENNTNRKGFELVHYIHSDEDGYWSNYGYQFWSYPRKSDGTFANYHADIQSLWYETSPDVFEQEIRLASNNGKYHLGFGSFNHPLNSTDDDQMLVIRQSDGGIRVQQGGLKNITSIGAGPMFTETGTQTNHSWNTATVNFTKQTRGIVIVTGSLAFLNATMPNPQYLLTNTWIEINGNIYGNNATNYKFEHAYFGVSTEQIVISQYAFDLPAGTHTFGMGYNAQFAPAGMQGSVGEYTYSILYV